MGVSSLPFKLNVDGDSIKQIIQRVQASLSKASDRLETDYGFNNGHGWQNGVLYIPIKLGMIQKSLLHLKQRGMAGKLQDLLIQQVKLYFSFCLRKILRLGNKGR